MISKNKPENCLVLYILFWIEEFEIVKPTYKESLIASVSKPCSFKQDNEFDNITPLHYSGGFED